MSRTPFSTYLRLDNRLTHDYRSCLINLRQQQIDMRPMGQRLSGLFRELSDGYSD
jgi:hypothetical protein